MRHAGPALALAAAVLGACASTQQTASDPAPADAREPGDMVGIGGVFFRSSDTAATQRWYTEHLGMPPGGPGFALIFWTDPETDEYYSTTWSPFPRDSDYFGLDQQYMLNYIVNDLDAALARLRAAGARIDDDKGIETYPNGRFAWFWDPEGNKAELWEPDRAFFRENLGR
ncbi:MAG: VOC family protein [Planctomycetota bacterium]